MSEERFGRAAEIFLKARGCPQSERAAILEAECADDPALREEVDRLLHGDAMPTPFRGLMSDIGAIDLGSRDLPGAGPVEPVDCADKPAAIGPYTLLRPIGEGGLGTVYLAEQEHPIRRQVALKIIRRGMETRNLIARFEVERQALALMDHTNIARVFDAGETGQGLPYFAMELVEGLPITRYCDQKQLPIRLRLGLFVQVCHAIGHAHQKGVIHRDIKPSNVLVATVDDQPVPKVIDFGIAKATEPALADYQMTLTGVHQMVGTPLYMSPEQMSKTRGGVDTRSDIYSLGVLLYELLTGVMPFDAELLGTTEMEELRKIIREVEPPAPSTRIARTATPEALAKNRGTEPAKLRRLLRGELDWVVMKAIAKDRERRYETAGGLGADLTRYLEYEPVLAGPPGMRYRARKFVQRYRIPLAVACTVAASLLIGLGATTVGMVRAIRAERAVAHEKSVAIEELWNARLQQARAGRFGGQPGQRIQGLAALAAAAQVRPALALRNEAIACMALTDIEPTGPPWDEHRGDPMPVKFDGPMQRYATVDTQGNISIYRTADRQKIRTLSSPGGVIGYYVSFSPGGRFLAATYHSSEVSFRVWDLEEGRTVLQLHGPLESELAIDYVRGGGSIAVAEAAGKIAIYQLPSGVRSTISAGARVLWVKGQPQGNVVAAWGPDRILRIVSLETGRTLSTIELPFKELTPAASWHPDGRRIGLCAEGPLNPADTGDRMYVIDSLTGERLSVLQGHLSQPQVMQFSPDGQVIASGAWDGTLRLWDGPSGKLLLTTSEYGGLIQASDDGLQLAARGTSYCRLLHCAMSRECRHLGGLPSDVEYRAGDFSVDGSVFAAAAAGRGIRTWNIASGLEAGSMPLPGVRSILFSSNGKELLVSDPRGVRQVALSPDANLPSLPDDPLGAGGTGALDRSRDGRTVVYGMGDGSIFAASVDDLKNPVKLGAHAGFPRFVAVSADGSWAASSTRFVREFKVWDVRNRRLAVDLPCISTTPETGAMAFSPDSRWLVTSEPDCYSWWEVGTWKLHHRVPRTSPAIAGMVAFSNAGRLLAAAGPGYSIILLDPDTGAELATLADPEQHGPAWLVFSTDGTQLAVVNADRAVTIWDLKLIRRELSDLKLDW